MQSLSRLATSSGAPQTPLAGNRRYGLLTYPPLHSAPVHRMLAYLYMKTPLRITQDIYPTSIQFIHALSSKSERPPVRPQSFLAPWAALRTANQETDVPAGPSAFSPGHRVNKTSTASLAVPDVEPVIVKVKVSDAPADRLELKVTIRDEAFPRQERSDSEHRFWGINE
jgi:hypothetical protein